MNDMEKYLKTRNHLSKIKKQQKLFLLASQCFYKYVWFSFFITFTILFYITITIILHFLKQLSKHNRKSDIMTFIFLHVHLNIMPCDIRRDICFNVSIMSLIYMVDE